MSTKGRMALGKKLLVLFLAVGVIPFATMAIISLWKSKAALSDQAFNQLTMAREIKKSQIESYFEERKGDMGVLRETAATLRSEAFAKLEAIQEMKKEHILDYFKQITSNVNALKDNPTTVQAISDFEKAFEAEGKKTGGTRWSSVESVYGAVFEDILNDNGYYDVFLLSADGDVVYTVTRESDLGANLVRGSLSSSGLARAFEGAKEREIAIADFEPYAPSGNQPAGFIAGPVKNARGSFIGAVAIQIPIGQINDIMMLREGMGETGESYLVGQDYLMRSDSYLDPEGHSVKASFANKAAVRTEAVESALSGNSDEDVITDYNGNPVLSCWDPVDIGDGIRWAMLSEIDVAEAFCPKDENGEYYFAKYVDMYGYYDLFLMNPDGYCFYTVAREADYQTNFVSGKYASSNLGKLTREVMKTHEFGMVDFEPYAPSNGEPAAFIAEPVTHDGNIEMVVALQLSLSDINSIMQQREGMGETGETYLIGPDKLMRSDSYLDPEGHSVKASFAGNVEDNGVDTEAAREALSGNTDCRIITDYNGNPVLSAYTPVGVLGHRWALLAEIDESEAMATVNSITWLMIVIGIIGVAAILLVAITTARSISKPINLIIENLTDGANQVGSASEQVASASQSLAEGSSEQASSIEETSSSLEEMSSMTKQNADNASQASSLAKDANIATEKGMNSVNKMSSTMQSIKKSSDETAKIIKVIDEIAFQTNLLALNAAVEAARAGDAGKGFAVVAEEVRNLAQRSAEAAKDTSGLIEGSQKNADEGVQATEEVVEILGNVTESIRKVSDLLAEVASASQEQAQGVEQVNTAVSQMDKVTQTTAANAEESSSASEELAAQAQEMQRIVDELNTIIKGHSMNLVENNKFKTGGSSKSEQGSVEKSKKMLSQLKNRVNKMKSKNQDSDHSEEDVIPLSETEEIEF